MTAIVCDALASGKAIPDAESCQEILAFLLQGTPKSFVDMHPCQSKCFIYKVANADSAKAPTVSPK